MEPRSLKYVAEACAGSLLQGSPETVVTRVCSDSRHATEGDLFLALAGERFDGHDFLDEIAQKAVTAVVVSKHAKLPDKLSCGVIAVDNTKQALGRLGAHYRTDFDPTVVAIGGSNGKTTTKELVAAVLRQKLRTLWSEASFNNDIGVPMSLLRLEQTHEVAVVEVGTNHPGELAPLVQLIQPRFGVITNIGREHLEFFGDLTGVAEEEGWLAELLPAHGKLFLNGDDSWSGVISKRSRAKPVRVGLNPGNDWHGSEIEMDGKGSKFVIHAANPAFSGEYHINLLGNHQVVNALFAVALGAEMGLSRIEVQRGLLECKPARMRLETWIWNEVCVLDDAYNANLDSMLAALRTLRQMPCAGRRVAVLGDMAELGKHSNTAHDELGRQAAELGVGQLFTVGKMAEVIASSARTAGLKNVEAFADPASAAGAVKQYLKPGDVMLLKASRATHLERLSEALVQSAAIKNG